MPNFINGFALSYLFSSDIAQTWGWAVWYFGEERGGLGDTSGLESGDLVAVWCWCDQINEFRQGIWYLRVCFQRYWNQFHRFIEVVVWGTCESTNVSLENCTVLDEAGTKCIQMCISGPLLNLPLLALRKPKLCVFSSPFSLPLFMMRSLCLQLVHRLKDRGE